MAKRSARNKMMDYLAQRDHSEAELRKKLKKVKFETEEIDTAIQFGKEQGWIPDSETSKMVLSQKTATVLSRKKKGILYINHYLSEKGLPEVECNSALELEKAKELIENKFSRAIEKLYENKDSSFDERRKLQAKMARFLISRGFDSETVQRAIKKGRS